jgi:hypothetical protein
MLQIGSGESKPRRLEGIHRPIGQNFEGTHNTLEGLRSRVRQRIAQLGGDPELVLLDKDLLEYANEIMAARKLEIERWHERLAALSQKQERFIRDGGQYLLNGKSPETINEHVLHECGMYYRHTELTAWFCNKLTAKLLIAGIVGPQYVARLYGAFTNLDEVYNPVFWARLPQKFVVKGVLGSYGETVRVVDKTDQQTINSLQCLTKTKKSRTSTERIIVEEFLPPIEEGRTITDFKFLCYFGEIVCVIVGDAPSTGVVTPADKWQILYTVPNWHCLPAQYGSHNPRGQIAKPVKLEEMMQVAQRLSSGFPLIRVDLYLTTNELGQTFVKVGEITRRSARGRIVINPVSYDFLVGQLVHSPLATHDSLIARDHRAVEAWTEAMKQNHEFMDGLVMPGFNVNPDIHFNSRSVASFKRLEELRNLPDIQAEVPNFQNQSYC